MNKIDLDNGKYSVINELNEGGGFRALRFGGEWRNLAGDNLILAMYFEIERYKEVLEDFANNPQDYDNPSQMSEVARAYLDGTEDEDR